MSNAPALSNGNEIDIQPLISKLGHDVEEIRVRSLKNILFKLDHELIDVSDVVYKKEIFMRLLEWFNFEPCTNQEEALKLLDKLSKHPAGLETLLSIGAIEFLSHLRQDVEPCLYELIDNVLSNLLSIPNMLDDGNNVIKLLYCEKGSSLEVPDSIPTIDNHVKGFDIELKNSIENVTSKKKADSNEDQFDVRNQQNMDIPKRDEIQDFARQRTFSWTFPWFSLAYSDRHILTTTNSRLQSDNSDLVVKSCEFLNDVLFKDFPTEIFLQRPTIFMTLLRLLELKPNEDFRLVMAALKCLSNLCVQLTQRYLTVSDTALYSLQNDCWKEWLNFASSSSSPSPVSELSDFRTTGDGGEQSSSSSKATSISSTLDEDDDDHLMREALEMNQMPLDEFCLQVVRGCSSLLNVIDEPSLIIATMQHALKLLQVCCGAPNQWWNQSSKMRCLRKDICRVLVKVFDYHMLRCGLKSNDSVDIIEHNLTRHCMTVINMALWFIEFSGPFLQVDWDDNEVSEDFSEIFQILLLNEILFKSYPEIRHALEKSFFVMENQQFYEVYKRALDVKKSLLASVEFLKKVKEPNIKCDLLLKMLEPCIPSLPYHQDSTLIKHSILLISKIYQVPTSQETRKKAKENLMAFLSNYDDYVRLTSYERCLDTVRDGLKYDRVTNPTSQQYSKIAFLIDRNVLYTICAYGMMDANEEVANKALCIIETLLENRLSMSGELWKKFLKELITSLPYLQMHLGKRPKLDACLLGLLSPPGESPHALTADGEVVPLSPFERLRGCLRCMFHKEKTIRAKGHQNMLRQLVRQDAMMKQDFVYPVGSLENSCDLFMIQTFALSTRCHRVTRHANFDEEKLRKLLDILTTDNSELSLRKASAEQLAIIMQDPSWHASLLNHKVVDMLVDILSECLSKDGKVHISAVVNPKLELVAPCFRILRLLCEFNITCRHTVSQNSSLYFLAVRHALLAPVGGTVRYETACLLTLLLFDEVAQLSKNADELQNEDINFGLPGIFLKRYQLPFNPPIRELHDVLHYPVQPDPLFNEPVLSLLRVAWNLAWCNDEGQIPKRPTTDNNETRLSWTLKDAQLLQSCSPVISITASMLATTNASSHYAVKLLVKNLSLHFLAGNLATSSNHSEDDRSICARDIFYSCDWKTSFDRYFRVYPKNTEDDSLFIDVLKMFRYLIEHSQAPPAFLGWLAHVIMSPDNSVSVLLSSPSDNQQQNIVSDSKRILRKELLEFLVIFIGKLRALPTAWLWGGDVIYAGDFTMNLTLNLNLTESPQYYDLPILESTLQCLVEITALHDFSNATKHVEPKELSSALISSLLQVLTAFHAGRLEAFTSFMGRGVTVCVSLCLVHLIHEVSTVLRIKDWPSLFYTPMSDSKNEESQPDLSWLSPMLTDHIPEVRWCSLVIATCIVAHGRTPLIIPHSIPGGIWNLAMIIFMDGRECCLVRNQALLLFAILVATLKDDGAMKYETGLLVQTENEIVRGVSALHLLLTYHHFYDSLPQLLSNVIYDSTQQLPAATTFTRSATSSDCTRDLNIPYQSLDTDSDKASLENTCKAASPMASSQSEDSGRQLLKDPSTSPSVHSTASVSTEASSTIPLLLNKTNKLSRNEVASASSTADSAEILSWATPRFVGSLSGLLVNLVSVSSDVVLSEIKEKNILGLFISHIDVKHVKDLMIQITKEKSPSRRRHSEMNLINLMNMYKMIGLLLKTCTERDLKLAHALHLDKETLKNILHLLFIHLEDTDVEIHKCCDVMKKSLLELLLIVLKRNKATPLLLSPLEDLLVEQWTTFSDSFRMVLAGTEIDLKSLYLHFLSHILLLKAKRVVSGVSTSHSITGILEQVDGNDVTSNGRPRATKECSRTVGSGICSILLKEYKETKNEDQRILNGALRNLLCISKSAKRTALEGGFLTTLLENVKQFHSKLNMESLEIGKGSAPRKKEMELINEMVRILEVLKNLLFRSEETKIDALNIGITSVLHQLWSWCTVNRTLRSAVLQVLCTLTAHCTQASVTMCNTSLGIGSSVRMGPSNNTFVHCVIKMALKMSNKALASPGEENLASCQLLFSLLKNMAMTVECRGILWKSNFISEFSRLKPVSRQKWKTGHKTVVALWLELLANIAFHRDGQQMIVKIENVVPTLLELCESSLKRMNEAALMVLRNLCFHVASKTLLLSNNDVVEVLLRNIEKQSVYVRSLATSAFWALLTNNQKAKSILRKPMLVVKRLSDSRHTLKVTAKDGNNEEDIQLYITHYENAVQNILKILS